MAITGALCKECGTGDVHSMTYKFYDDDNRLVAKLHKWIVRVDQGYQAKIVAKDSTWIDFETQELTRPRPNLFEQFYGGHPGVLIINSEFVPNLQSALDILAQEFPRARAWLDARLGTPTEIV